jgi:hypothetical protein
VDEKGQKELLGGRTTDCSTGKGGTRKGAKNRDKKVVMVKLIIQKHTQTCTHTHKNQVQEQQKVQFSGKSSRVIP